MAAVEAPSYKQNVSYELIGCFMGFDAVSKVRDGDLRKN